MTTKQLTLPITGMTCANCVSTIERNLKKLEGMQVAAVNLASVLSSSSTAALIAALVRAS